MSSFRRSREAQVQAAGGPGSRDLRIESGKVVVASIAVRSFTRGPNQSYAYLQYKDNMKTVTKYVGRVTADTRADSLKIGWDLVRKRKLVESLGWRWVRSRHERTP